MSKIRYHATFSLPTGGEFVLTRGSLRDYGYTYAWLLLAGEADRLPQGEILAKGFSRDRRLAESAVRPGLYGSRSALFAPVSKIGGDT